MTTLRASAADGARVDYRVLGVRISPLTREQWLAVVQEGVEAQERRLLVSQNLHSTYLNSRNSVVRRIQERADVVRIDGMPLVWVARLLGLPVSGAQRAGFMDLMPVLMAASADRGWKVFVIGGKPGVAEEAATVLRTQYPGLSLATEDGYFPLDDGDGGVSSRLARVAVERPDVVLVGMGMPRQEEFLDRYLERISAPVVGTCGAAFDYVAGAIPMAPRWMSALGFEWLFRLVAEPMRLWRRYLVEPLHLIPFLLADLRSRRFGERHFRYQPKEADSGEG